LEGLLRGFRSGILRAADYNNLAQCETLEDVKLHLASTDYGDFLANEMTIHTTTIADKAGWKLVKEFAHLRAQAAEPLATFLDYITYQYMIDNVILLITGTLHERDTNELLEKCHPLGIFDSMATLRLPQSVSELYNAVLIDTPLAPYIVGCLSEEDLDEMNIEIIRNTLYKAYLQDFYDFCQKLGGVTAVVMGEILMFEADRRAINITINSFGTELTKEDRRKLYPEFGILFPEGTQRLAKCDDPEQVRQVVETYNAYKMLYSSGTSISTDRSLEDSFFEYEVNLNRLAFERQFGYGAFYAYFKLREQEIRNIVWIAECIQQDQRDKVHNFITIF